MSTIYLNDFDYDNEYKEFTYQHVQTLIFFNYADLQLLIIFNGVHYSLIATALSVKLHQ